MSGSTTSNWVTIDVKVRREPGNEAGWPDVESVAAVIRERLEDRNLKRGWRIVSVSPSTR